MQVRILDLKTPSLISMMVGPHQPKTIEIVQPTRRSFEAPIYAIDLNVFFDAIRDRERSEDAGAVFEAAFRHQVRLATTQEFLLELKRKSISGSNDPVLAFAKRIPILPSQSKAALEKLQHSIAEIVFPERSARAKLSENDVADTSHLAHAIAGGASGYVTSDGKILNARDSLIAKYDLDVIGLSEFVDLLELPEINAAPPPKGTNNFRLQTRSDLEISTFIKRQNIEITHFLASEDLSSHRCLSIRDDDGIIGASVVSPSSGIDQASRAIVCVDQSHTFASTIADYLISDLCSQLSSAGPHHLSMLDIPSHPITRRIALSQGFQRHDQIALSKISFGRPITTNSWPAARRAIERLAGIKLQQPCPAYDAKKIKMITSRGEEPTISPSELETFLSPTIFAFSNRKAVIVPISRSYAADLLGTDQQYSLLDVPEATFMSRRTYFNTTNAARAMIRGAVIAFYENGKKGGRGAIVALGRIVDVTTVPVGNIPEKLGRGAVVEDIGAITSAPRVLATTFDNLIPLQNPVKLKRLREIGCDTRTNFISATPVSASHLKAIVDAGFSK